MGMSAALIGSGMAFEYPLFYDAMMDNTSVGGFDRVLEMKLLYKGIHIHYLPDTIVRDEKIQKANSFYRQRRRWLNVSGVMPCHRISCPLIRHCTLVLKQWPG